MAHALVPTACGRGFWDDFFGSRSPQLDPIIEGTRAIKSAALFMVRGSRRLCQDLERITADLAPVPADHGGRIVGS